MLAAGIVNFGIQGSLFIFLLYALLAAETDPLSYTIKVLVGICAASPECFLASARRQHTAFIISQLLANPLPCTSMHRAAAVR